MKIEAMLDHQQGDDSNHGQSDIYDSVYDNRMIEVLGLVKAETGQPALSSLLCLH